MFYVYVLYSSILNKRYVGSTSDIEKRLKEHNSGKSKFTSGGIPWKIIYSEKYSSNGEARKRELFLKSGKGRKLLDEILNSKLKGSAPEAHQP